MNKSQGTAWLEGLSGEFHGRSIAVSQGDIRLGRGQKCQIQLHERSISRHHASIRFAQGRYYLQDQGSGLGTLVNGHVVRATALEDGDIISIGDNNFRFRLSTTAQPIKPSPEGLHRISRSNMMIGAFVIVSIIIVSVIFLSTQKEMSGRALISPAEEVTVIDPNGLQVHISPYTFFEETEVVISLVESDPSGFGLPTQMWEIDADDHTINRTITLQIPYDLSITDGTITEDEIFAITWDGTSWVHVEGEVDTDDQIIRVETDHLSLWSWLWDRKAEGEGEDIEAEIVGVSIPETALAGEVFDVQFTGRNAGSSDHEGAGFFVVTFLESGIDPAISAPMMDWDGSDGLLGSTLVTSASLGTPVPGHEQIDERCGIRYGQFKPVAIISGDPGLVTIEVALIFEDMEGREISRDVEQHEVLTVNVRSVLGDVEVDGAAYKVITREIGQGVYEYEVRDENDQIIENEEITQKAIFAASVQQDMQAGDIMLLRAAEMMGTLNKGVMHIQDPLGYLLLRPGEWFLSILKGGVGVLKDVSGDVVWAMVKTIANHPKGTAKDIAQTYYAEVMDRLHWNNDLTAAIQSGEILTYEEAKQYIGNNYFIGIYSKVADEFMDNILMHSYNEDAFNKALTSKAVSDSASTLRSFKEFEFPYEDSYFDFRLEGTAMGIESTWFVLEVIRVAQEIWAGLEAYPPYRVFREQEIAGWQSMQSAHEVFLTAHGLTLDELASSFELMGIVNWRELTIPTSTVAANDYTDLETFKQVLAQALETKDFDLLDDLIADRFYIWNYTGAIGTADSAQYDKYTHDEALDKIISSWGSWEAGDIAVDSSQFGNDVFATLGIPSMNAVTYMYAEYWMMGKATLGISESNGRYYWSEVVPNVDVWLDDTGGALGSESPSGEVAYIIYWAEDPSKIGELWVVDVEDGSESKLREGGGFDYLYDIVWSTDGDRVTFTGNGSDYYAIELNNPHQLIATNQVEIDEPDLPAWALDFHDPNFALGSSAYRIEYSPDGNWAAIFLGLDQHTCPDLWVFDSNGANGRWTASCMDSVSWSPSSQWLAYTLFGLGFQYIEIWVMSPHRVDATMIVTVDGSISIKWLP